MSATQKASQGGRDRPGKSGRPSRSKASGGTRERLVRGSEVSRVKRVRDRYGLKQPEMSRLLGVSARTLSELESQPKEPRQETKRRLAEVERLYRALSEIIDADGIAAWMQEPNDGFDGSTPLQVVERGEIDRIWQMIYAVRTGHPS